MAEKTYAVAPLRKVLLDGNEYEFRLTFAVQKRAAAHLPKSLAQIQSLEGNMDFMGMVFFEACLSKRGLSADEFFELLPPATVLKDWHAELEELSKNPAATGSPTTASAANPQPPTTG